MTEDIRAVKLYYNAEDKSAAKLIVNGKDISSCVCNVEFKLGVDGLPYVNVTLIPTIIEVDSPYTEYHEEQKVVT